MSTGEPQTVQIGEYEFIRLNDEWLLWCGCGDCIPLDEVVHDHCVNCHVLCLAREGTQ